MNLQAAPGTLAAASHMQQLQRLLRDHEGGSGSADKRESLATQISISIGADIVEGRILPGDEIPSAVIAHRFQTSRTPVREALLMLERIGLVQVRPRRRPRVTLLPRHEISEIYDLRELLYGAVAEKVTLIASTEVTAELSPLLVAMREAVASSDADAYFWAKADLHERIVRLARDETLRQMIELLGVRVMQFGRLGAERIDEMSDSCRDHERLIEAFQQGERELARAMFTMFVRSARSRLLARYDTEYTSAAPE